jgi:uncharacterized protein (TIGR02001 family)
MFDQRWVIPVAFVLVLASGPVLAEEEEKGDWLPGEFSATVALTSDYIFRGVSQTDHEPALQGSIGYSVETGILGTSLFGGVWGSNVDFNDGDEAHVELDWSFGLSGDVADTGIGWSLGGVYYHYPGARSGLNYDYWEVPLTLTYSPVEDLVTLTGSYFYSPDFFAASGDGHYVNGKVAVTPDLTKYFDIALFGALGHQWVDDNSRFGAEDYLDWTLGITVTIKGVDLTAAYTDTDLSKSDCFGGTNLCEPRAVFSIGKAF